MVFKGPFQHKAFYDSFVRKPTSLIILKFRRLLDC